VPEDDELDAMGPWGRGELAAQAAKDAPRAYFAIREIVRKTGRNAAVRMAAARLVLEYASEYRAPAGGDGDRTLRLLQSPQELAEARRKLSEARRLLRRQGEDEAS